MIRETPVPVAELVRSGRVARSSAESGPASRLGCEELVETGTDRRARRTEAGASSRSSIGLRPSARASRPKRMVEIAAQLDLETPDEFRAAARGGSLRQVRGIGPATERKVLERLEADRYAAGPRAPAPARPRAGSKASPTRSAATVAGDAAAVGRRAVGPSRRRPGRGAGRRARRLRAAAADRRGRRALASAGSSASPWRASRSSSCRRRTARFGTELVRATGCEGLRRGTRAAARMGSTRPRSTTRSACPGARPSCARRPSAASRRSSWSSADVRGDLHCHTTWSDGKASVMEMAVAARERGYEYLAICDHTPNVRVVPGLDADALRRQAEEIAEANEALAPFRDPPRRRGRHPPRRLARSSRRRARRAGLGAAQPPCRTARATARRSRQGGRGHAASRRALPQPPDRPDPRSPAAERARPRDGVRDRARARHRGRGQRPARPARPVGTNTSGWRSRRAFRSSSRPTRTPFAVSTTWSSPCATARRGWATAEDVLNTRPLDAVLSHRAR